MSTIVKKVLLVAWVIAVIAFALLATVNTITFSSAFKKAINEKVFNETEKFSNQISMIFENAEGTVDTLAVEISHHFDIAQQHRNPEYINKYIEEFSPVMEDSLVDIEDAQGLYFTFNPEITDKKNAYEIWYSYDEKGEIVSTDATKNGIFQTAFLDDTLESMWYYFNALNAQGNGVWTEPYTDPDIDEEVIAYSVAVYKEDELLGVVGTDISTEHTTQVISDMHVSHGGIVLLLDNNGRVICTSDNDRYKSLCKPYGFINRIQSKVMSEYDGIFSEQLDQEDIIVSYSRLSNGWKLAIINYEDELYKAYYNILITVIILAITLIGILLVVIYLVGRKLTSPLDKAVDVLKMMDLDDHIEEQDTKNVKDEDDILKLVNKAVKRQRTSDMMLSNQSKLATVGEMMTNVTHQWKQPLNSINIILGNLKDDIENSTLDKDEALKAVRNVEKLTTGMAETLKDFSDYMKPDTMETSFNVSNVTEDALTIMADKIKARNIIVTLHKDESLCSFGYKNSFYHVMLNVIGNAVDAIEESNIRNGEISIAIKRSSNCDDKILIEVFDNGNKISDETMENLFIPYYTTKSDGTGLGLSISKHLVESKLNGSINLENVDNGVKCTIEIRGKEEGYHE